MKNVIFNYINSDIKMNPEHTAYYIETLGEKFIENGMIPNNDTYHEFVKWMGPISPIGVGNHQDFMKLRSEFSKFKGHTLLKGVGTLEDFMNCYVEEKKSE